MNETLSDTTVDQGTNTGSDLGWRSALPDDLKNHELIKDYTKPGDAIQDFVKLKTEAASMIKVPGENATEADRAAFFNTLGRPETAEQYTFTKPENLPDGMTYDENLETAFKGIFHEVGLSDTAAAKLWGKYHEMAANGYQTQQKNQKEALDKAVGELKNEWQGDQFKSNTEIAHRAFTKVFDDETKQSEAKAFIEETMVNGLALGNHPMFLKIFHQIGSFISDDRLGTGKGDGIRGGLSDEEAARRRFPNTNFDK